MPYIVPTIFKPLDGGKEYTVWMVNHDDPNESGWVQFSVECPHCGESNVFRFFEYVNYEVKGGWAYEHYDCKCPKCRRVWQVVEKLEPDHWDE